MAEDRFHEIQLSSKQLVFLFMAAAVVAAVIFLSGVMVGRGVRAVKEPLEGAGALSAQAAEPPAGGGTRVSPPGEVPSAPPSARTQPAGDELSYYSRLEAAGSPKETLKAAPPTPETPGPDLKAKPAAAPPPPRPSTQPARPSDSAVTSPPPKTVATPPAGAAVADTERPAGQAGGVFSVQVGALRNRAGADAIVKSLAAKGYDAYVVGPQGSSSLYRVRVGRFKDRRDAEDLMRRLEKENYKPLITR